MYDVVIVGGGPAGLAAGLYAARAEARCVILEQGAPGGALLKTARIDNYPGSPKANGYDLAAAMAAMTEEAGCPIHLASVTAIRAVDPVPAGMTPAEGDAHGPAHPGRRWEVVCAERTYVARTVILGAGGHHVALDVPGVGAAEGRGLSYCAVCDGPFYRGQQVVVVGGGDSACEEAEYLAGIAAHVTLVHRRDTFRAAPSLVRRVREHPRIRVVTNTVIDHLVLDHEGVTGVVLAPSPAASGAAASGAAASGGEQGLLSCRGVFPFLGFSPNRHLAPHAAHAPTGHLLTDESRETNWSGLYAVGDVRAGSVRQVTTAVADGTVAALAAAARVRHLAALGPSVVAR